MRKIVTTTITLEIVYTRNEESAMCSLLLLRGLLPPHHISNRSLPRERFLHFFRVEHRVWDPSP
jgi:hypothetical protein